MGDNARNTPIQRKNLLSTMLRSKPTTKTNNVKPHQATDPADMWGEEKRINSNQETKSKTPHTAEEKPKPRPSSNPNGQKRQHKNRTSDFVCTNNALDKRLRENGGTKRLGKPSECFRKGVGAGYYANIENEKQCLEQWTAPYKKHIDQRLHYKDSSPPPGVVQATLPQCVSRGFAVGPIKKAEELMKEKRHQGRAVTSN